MCLSPIRIVRQNIWYTSPEKAYQHNKDLPRYVELVPQRHDPLGIMPPRTHVVIPGFVEPCSPDEKYNVTYVSCGCCPECLDKKTNEWSDRLRSDFADMHAVGYFVTLTYDNDHLPHTILDSKVPLHDGIAHQMFVPRHDEMTNKTRYVEVERYIHDCNNGVLIKQDLTKFIKRLRRILSKYYDVRIKHFSCGEYGHDDQYKDANGRNRKGTLRPHFHIEFYYDIRNNNKVYGYVPYKRIPKNSVMSVYEDKIPPLNLFVIRHIVNECWKYGISYTERITSAEGACKYVSKYVLKSKLHYNKPYKNAIVSPPFRTQSQGIGKGLVTRLIDGCKKITAINMPTREVMGNKTLFVDYLKSLLNYLPIGFVSAKGHFRFLPAYVFRQISGLIDFGIELSLRHLRQNFGLLLSLSRTTDDIKKSLKIINDRFAKLLERKPDVGDIDSSTFYSLQTI